MGDETPPTSQAEAVRIGELVERIALLKRVLEASPPDGAYDPVLWYRFLSVIKLTQGNLSNDVSFVTCLLAKGFLAAHHRGVVFDAAAKAQGAPGLDVDLRTPEGARIIAEIKTTDPYKPDDFGSQQKTKFREDFAKLNKHVADFKYLFVTEQRTYDILLRKYAPEIPEIRIVLLTEREGEP